MILRKKLNWRAGMYLLVIYVPEESLEKVKSAVFTEGEGKWGITAIAHGR